MNKHLLKKKYDDLYDRGEALFKKYKPCLHDKNGRCEDYRNGTSTMCNCCDGCKHLSPSGCTVRSLACKLWHCSIIYNEYPKLAEALHELKLEAQYQGVVMGLREPFSYTENYYLDWFINRQKELKEEEKSG